MNQVNFLEIIIARQIENESKDRKSSLRKKIEEEPKDKFNSKRNFRAVH